MRASKEEVLDFIQNFQTAYFIDRNVHAVLDMLSPNILWDGIRKEDRCMGIQEIEKLFQLVNQNKTLQCSLNCVSDTIQEVSSDTYVDQKILQIVEKSINHKVRYIMLSITYVCVYENQQYLLHEIHYSILGNDHFISDFFVAEFLKDDSKLLEKILHEKTVELEQKNEEMNALTNNVPGGIFSCLFDENLTIMQMSDGFMSLVGYTREEIKNKFHNSFYAMIYAEDRETSMQEVLEQLKKGNSKQIQYRILHKQGYVVWVLDKGQLMIDEQQRKTFHCILVDITQDKKTQESLRLSLERYKIIMDQTNDIIFEWDIIQDYLTLSLNWEKKFGYRPKLKHNHVCLFDHERMTFHPHDIHELKRMMLEVQNGKAYVEIEVRIIDSEKRYIWCRIRTTTQFNAKGRPIKAIGIIVDIDREKKESENLLKKAERDALTGMYNKVTSQNMIRTYLINCQKKVISAVMIIDIDNFKTINDTYGHLYGDAVLAEVSREIKKTFHKNDIIGRIGGDEFIVFIKDVQCVENIKCHAEGVIQAIHDLQVNGKREIELSCSIGISMYPKDGDILSDLYRNSDHALYQAKSNGKNCYVLYDQHDMSNLALVSSEEERSVISEKIDSNENIKILNSKLIEYVFRILYKSIDIETAVQTILKIVGMEFDVSRTYIFENIEEDKYCCNTFEWCNEGEEPQIENLRHVSYEEDLGGSYWDNFNEEGIFYCRDIADLPREHYEILAPQGIKSILQCAISNNGILKGYVGFDECRKNRYWTQEQIASLVFIAEILSTFLLKKRAEEQLRQESEGLRAVLDNQNAWIYVINPKDYAMLFINKKTKERVPKSQIGMKCHEAFLNSSERCKDCPAMKVNKHHPNFMTEFYNPTLHLWSNADASFINWKGEDAIMLACHDISNFK